MERFDVPVLLITYKRLDTTQKVLERIAEVKPSQLYISSNAPNPAKPEEVEKVQAVRSMIESRIDWPCDLKKLYRIDHVGPGVSISSAINWFFENVEEGIIFEDDTVPDVSFFSFCKAMLNKYRDENKIKIIGGINFQDGLIRGDASYYFTRLCHIWGWATWRRVWKEYDFELKSVSREDIAKAVNKYFGERRFVKEWEHIYDNLKSKAYDTWDYQLALIIWKNDGINIIPQKNLITNIGYGQDAAHTTGKPDPFSNMPAEDLGEIHYATEIKVDKEADLYSLNKIFPIYKRTLSSIGRSIMRKLKIS